MIKPINLKKHFQKTKNQTIAENLQEEISNIEILESYTTIEEKNCLEHFLIELESRVGKSAITRMIKMIRDQQTLYKVDGVEKSMITCYFYIYNDELWNDEIHFIFDCTDNYLSKENVFGKCLHQAKMNPLYVTKKIFS